MGKIYYPERKNCKHMVHTQCAPPSVKYLPMRKARVRNKIKQVEEKNGEKGKSRKKKGRGSEENLSFKDVLSR